MLRIKNRFAELVAEKERKDGRKWTYDDISKATGVSTNSLSGYARNKVRRFDAVTVEALLAFFGCGIADFFTLEQSEEIEGQQVAVA